jgi:hypothetical protein
MSAILPQLKAGFIDSNLDQPSAEFTVSAETRQRGKSLQDSLLGNLFCISRIIQNRHGGSEDATLAGLYEAIKGILVAFANALNQFRFVASQVGFGRAHRHPILPHIEQNKEVTLKPETDSLTP